MPQSNPEKPLPEMGIPKSKLGSEDPFDELVPGRIVHYWPMTTETRYAGEGNGGPWPAMVTKVWPQPGVVTLNLNLPVAIAIGTDPVQRRAEVAYSEAREPGCWSWIPRE